ncbi:M20 aminoacylase family protein [Antarcticimicrobium sediminis]|uniref:Amidohydrolase n=1 Tax=Antarcticimicrobium sediminis TaxID=2546227 RepID=A0A4R5ELH9_9RHOB|nr:M20 aminoacylase family protein [Antarcticimicrobium sediminis]TDE35551.1 amidohydrolase [Antarcticimicrobium sediminis]
MGLIKEIVAQKDEFAAWRRAMHENPGIGFEESFAAELVETKLHEFGFDEVHTCVGKTGVVGVLRGKRASNRAIGLRADMDALPILEETGKVYASKTPGVMHACGHDGHTATLLAAASHMSRTRDFSGTVHFIFQPAEEGLGGALAMLNDGLFERFPCDRIYAYHNAPGLEFGHVYMRHGRAMAGSTFFTIKIQGKGGHAAMPAATIDPTQIASNIVLTAQSIVSRNLDTEEKGILSFTDVYAGTNSHNVIPDKATLKGCFRYFDAVVGNKMKDRFTAIIQSVANSYGGTSEVEYVDTFAPLVNDAEATDIAAAVAGNVVGKDKVHTDLPAMPGSEDFSFLMEKIPGNYLFVGAGPGASPHNPNYDFNDEIIPAAASYFCRLVETELA